MQNHIRYQFSKTLKQNHAQVTRIDCVTSIMRARWINMAASGGSALSVAGQAQAQVAVG